MSTSGRLTHALRPPPAAACPPVGRTRARAGPGRRRPPSATSSEQTRRDHGARNAAPTAPNDDAMAGPPADGRCAHDDREHGAMQITCRKRKMPKGHTVRAPRARGRRARRCEQAGMRAARPEVGQAGSSIEPSAAATPEAKIRNPPISACGSRARRAAADLRQMDVRKTPAPSRRDDGRDDRTSRQRAGVAEVWRRVTRRDRRPPPDQRPQPRGSAPTTNDRGSRAARPRWRRRAADDLADGHRRLQATT